MSEVQPMFVLHAFGNAASKRNKSPSKRWLHFRQSCFRSASYPGSETGSTAPVDFLMFLQSRLLIQGRWRTEGNIV